jgi:MFS family permease
MIFSDLGRFGVFAALPFVDSAAGIEALAAVAGVATGFFRPAAYAGLPNLVDDAELANANSLLQTVENGAWMIGPLIGAGMVELWSPHVPYTLNAVTFLVSAALVSRIRESQLRSEESLTQGHWRDVADGIRLVLTAKPLKTVLVVWNIVVIGNAAINVAEVVFAKDVLGGGDLGFGALVAGSGLGLVIGSYLAAPALAKVGLRRHYAGSIALMAFGLGGAAVSPSIWFAVPFIVASAAGNGAAIVCNQLLVQKGAPDRFRGRVLTTIMSSNFAILGLAMGATGVLTDVVGARWVFVGASGAVFVAGGVAVVMTRWLPVRREEEQEVLESQAAAALSGFARKKEGVGFAPRARVQVQTDVKPKGGLERIATLLEEIEARRELEGRRPTAD